MAKQVFNADHGECSLEVGANVFIVRTGARRLFAVTGVSEADLAAALRGLLAQLEPAVESKSAEQLKSDLDAIVKERSTHIYGCEQCGSGHGLACNEGTILAAKHKRAYAELFAAQPVEDVTKGT